MNKEATVQEQILDWSEDRPLWQRDALRRLFIKGSLEPSDKQELRFMALKEAGLALKTQPPEPKPLTKAHLPLPEGEAASVQLLEMSGVKGVNAPR